MRGDRDNGRHSRHGEYSPDRGVFLPGYHESTLLASEVSVPDNAYFLAFREDKQSLPKALTLRSWTSLSRKCSRRFILTILCGHGGRNRMISQIWASVQRLRMIITSFVNVTVGKAGLMQHVHMRINSLRGLKSMLRMEPSYPQNPTPYTIFHKGRKPLSYQSGNCHQLWKYESLAICFIWWHPQALRIL